MNKILVVSPHPDDEVLGCGGSLLKLQNDSNYLYWLIVTEVSEKFGWKKKFISERQNEIKKVKKAFNFKKTYNLSLPPKNLDQIPKTELIEKFSTVINNIKPNYIFIPFLNDVHSDHRITNEAFQACIKRFRFPYLTKIMMYETLSETDQNHIGRKFNPNIFFDITKYINKKILIAKKYKSEIKKHPFPRSIDSIKSLAILRGCQSNFKYAEAFELVYEVQ